MYLEKATPGKLINLDFVKKENDEIIFFPLIYRDKVKFSGKKKYHTVFEYLNNENTISSDCVQKIRKILKKQYPATKTFGTIDLIQTKERIKILEISPHFHHINLFRFLYNIDLIDLYFENYEQEIIDKKIFLENKLGGCIFLNTKNRFCENLVNFVKKNSIKIMIHNVQTNNKSKYLEKDFLINKSLRILYFECESLKNIRKIYLYLNAQKRKLFN